MIRSNGDIPPEERNSTRGGPHENRCEEAPPPPQPVLRIFIMETFLVARSLNFPRNCVSVHLGAPKSSQKG